MARARTQLDIQFGPTYDREKANRLVAEIRTLQSSLNGLIREFTSLSQSTSETTHAFLGPEHIFEGLPTGNFLKAIAPNEAAFEPISLADLDDVNTDGVENGQVMTKTADGYEFSSLPDLSNLEDPGGNRLVIWSDTDHSLGYTLAGTGLKFLGASLVVDSTQVNHDLLQNLGNDAHPQYTQWIDNEVVTGQWDFYEPIDFFDPSAVPELARYRMGVSGDFAIELVDLDGLTYDLLRVSRLAADAIDAVTWGTDDLMARYEFRGSIYLPDDDQGVYIGGDLGELRLYRNEEYAQIESTDSLYLETPDLLSIATDLLEAHAPLSVLVCDEAIDNAGRWTSELTDGRLTLGVFNEDGSGENWLTVDVDVDGIETINLTASHFRLNGADILAVSDTSLAVGAAGAASALPATPDIYAIVDLGDGVPRKMALYAV